MLRAELGTQLSLAQKEKKQLEEKKLQIDYRTEWNIKETKEWDKIHKKCQRLLKAVQALGAIQLGDIEDKDLF